jgi:hypothetical protein
MTLILLQSTPPAAMREAAHVPTPGQWNGVPGALAPWPNSHVTVSLESYFATRMVCACFSFPCGSNAFHPPGFEEWMRRATFAHPAFQSPLMQFLSLSTRLHTPPIPATFPSLGWAGAGWEVWEPGPGKLGAVDRRVHTRSAYCTHVSMSSAQATSPVPS